MLHDTDLKSRQRAIWALGDYHAFATTWIWDFGPMLVEACGISPGQRVLDVAAGSGNVAIRAAEVGATVVASDLTPENFEAGRREARAHGVELLWLEADAEALPFEEGEFDVVTSAVGAIFAPHHRLVADELLRVCRPGGTIGLIAMVRNGPAEALFDVMKRFTNGDLIGPESPLEWGDEKYVRELFGDRVESLTFEHRPLDPNPMAAIDDLKSEHPVFVSIYRELADQPERAAALDRELDEAAKRMSSERQEIMLIVARKRG
jgi:SAM-dependent methyltransferase